MIIVDDERVKIKGNEVEVADDFAGSDEGRES